MAPSANSINETEQATAGDSRAFLEYNSTRPVPQRVTLDNVRHVFTYQPWNEDQSKRGNEVREALISAVETILRNVPECPTRTRAINNLIDARMLANAAITHDGRY